MRPNYTEISTGFPLLATPGGGLHSRIAVWANAVINIPEEFKNDFRVITMDQRNAAGGESTGPVPVDDPWGDRQAIETATNLVVFMALMPAASP